MTGRDALAKRVFDIVFSALGLILSGWLILIAIAIATIDTRKFGLFTQERIGRHGNTFKIFKIRTMRDVDDVVTNVTTADDPRITTVGRLVRRSKIDELPQLVNVLLGNMSFVGPRPDVAGFADALQGPDRLVLSVRPGITGPASLEFRDEESSLRGHADPERFNREHIYPEKVRINLDYIRNYKFSDDIRILWRTLFPS